MDLSFRDFTCALCHRDGGLECCEWVDGEAGEVGENWVFAEQLGDRAGWNLSISPDSRVLFRCKHCQRFFVLSLACQEQPELLLPYQERRRPSLRVVLAVHPATQEPRALYIGQHALEAISLRHTTVDSAYMTRPPFYPYPIGTYRLRCRWTEGEERADFECEIARTFTPTLMMLDEPDVEVYSFTVEWTTDEGLSIFKTLLEREHGHPSSGGLADLNAMLSGRPRAVPAWAGPITEAAASARAAQAYRFLHWLENRTRRFVWDLYRDRYSPADAHDGKWWKGCFPEVVRRNIESAMTKASKLGGDLKGEHPLDYSDFEDLMGLIEKEWNFLSTRVNTDRDAVRGHFQYLKHFRHDIAHTRTLTHDDLLKLQQRAAEWARLLGGGFLDDCPHAFYPPYPGWSA